MGHSGWPRVARVGARRGSVPRRCAPGTVPGRKDGLEALLRQLGAEGVTVLGPVGDQAGPRRVRPRCHQGPGLSAVAALTACRAQGPAASIRQDVELGAEAAPAAAEGAPARAVQSHGGQIRIGLQVGPPARPDASVAPVDLAAIDRVPLAVRGRRRARRMANSPQPDLNQAEILPQYDLA